MEKYTKIFREKKTKNYLSFFTIALAGVFLLMACNQKLVDDEDKSQQSKPSMCQIQLAVNNTSGLARSAHPSGAFPTEWRYTAEAEEITSGTPFKASCGKVKKEKISLSVLSGKKYKITINAYKDQSAIDPIMSGSIEIEVPKNAMTLPKSQVLIRPINSPDEKGSIKLKLDFSDLNIPTFNTITSEYPSSWGSLSPAPSFTEDAPTGSKIYTLSASDVPVGTYNVKFNLINASDVIGVFYANNINVEPNRKTNSWLGCNPNTAYKVSPAEVMIRKTFCVASDGSDADDVLGTYAKPFKTVEKAVSMCTNSSVDYIIYIKDDLTHENMSSTANQAIK